MRSPVGSHGALAALAAFPPTVSAQTSRQNIGPLRSLTQTQRTSRAAVEWRHEFDGNV